MQRPAFIFDEQEWRAACNAIVSTAHAILTNEIGIIEGARKLCDCRFRVKAEDDKDFLFFVGLESETDHLPIGKVQKYWKPTALKNKQEEIASVEKFYAEKAFTACNNLIVKYRLDAVEKA